MRLLVARCEVTYTGRLSTVLPGATRLLMFKDDGSFLVHDDAGGYKPLNLDSERVPPGLLKTRARQSLASCPTHGGCERG
jgi:RecB family endonuclease NucS